ncbi:MAG: hypothetical protein JXR96_20230 [Deltaproteobacteria bacterium]|nr:hypothetical protein [Deltaproteobacteria bacterium]
MDRSERFLLSLIALLCFGCESRGPDSRTVVEQIGHPELASADATADAATADAASDPAPDAATPETAGAPPLAARALPVPPRQTAPWKPRERSEAAAASAALFERGFPDPRACAYRKVRFVAGRDLRCDRPLDTAAWVLPPVEGREDFAITTNGLLVRLEEVGEPADLEKDTLERLARYSNAMPDIRLSRYLRDQRSSEALGAAGEVLSPLQAAMLLRLGKPDLARRVLDGWRGQRPGTPPRLLELRGAPELCSMLVYWLWARYHQALCAHARADMLAASYANGLARDLETLQGEIRDGKKACPAIERAVGWMRPQVESLVRDLARRARADGSGGQLGGLQDVSCNVGPERLELRQHPRVRALVEEGLRGAGALIDCLERDQQLSRTVWIREWDDSSCCGRHLSDRVVPVGVYHLAYTALRELLPCASWEEIEAGAGDDEGICAKRRAAAMIARQYLAERLKAGTEPDFCLAQLEEDPESLVEAMEYLSLRAPATWLRDRNRDWTALYESSLKRRGLRFFGTGSDLYQRCRLLGQLHERLMAVDDRQALRRYASWLGRTILGCSEGKTDWLLLAPLWSNPGHPAWAELVEKLYGRRGSCRPEMLLNQNLRQIASPLLVLAPFRQQVLEILLDREPGPDGERVCDRVAVALSRVSGLPAFDPSWPESQRDWTLDRMRSLLERYGARTRFSEDFLRVGFVFQRERIRPASKADVEAGMAVFTLEGRGRAEVVPLGFPFQVEYWNPFRGRCCQGEVWQLERLADGRIFAGVTGPAGLLEVEAGGHFWLLPGSDDWPKRIGQDGGIGLVFHDLEPARIGGPLVLRFELVNLKPYPQQVPASLWRQGPDGASELARGVEISLKRSLSDAGHASEAVPGSAQSFATSMRTLAPLERVELQIDLGASWQIREPGHYDLRFIHMPGLGEISSDGEFSFELMPAY